MADATESRATARATVNLIDANRTGAATNSGVSGTQIVYASNAPLRTGLFLIAGIGMPNRQAFLPWSVPGSPSVPTNMQV